MNNNYYRFALLLYHLTAGLPLVNSTVDGSGSNCGMRFMKIVISPTGATKRRIRRARACAPKLKLHNRLARRGAAAMDRDMRCTLRLRGRGEPIRSPL